MTRSAPLTRMVLYLCGIALVLYILTPFLWVLSASLRLETEIVVRPPNWIPEHPTLSNYLYVFTGQPPQEYAERGLLRSSITQEALRIPQGLVNSLLIAVVVTAVNLIFGALAAYTFARENFRGRGAMYTFILASRLLPPVAVAIPIYLIINQLNLLDTKTALVLLHSAFTLPFTIWVLTLYFQSLPREMEDAALVDGCTRFGVLWNIVAPLAAPGLAAVGAFAFLFSYSEFLFALFTTQTINAKTIPVLISETANNPDASYSLIAVGIVLSILSPMMFAVVFRRFITTGLAASLGK